MIYKGRNQASLFIGRCWCYPAWGGTRSLVHPMLPSLNPSTVPWRFSSSCRFCRHRPDVWVSVLYLVSFSRRDLVSIPLSAYMSTSRGCTILCVEIYLEKLNRSPTMMSNIDQPAAVDCRSNPLPPCFAALSTLDVTRDEEKAKILGFITCQALQITTVH